MSNKQTKTTISTLALLAVLLTPQGSEASRGQGYQRDFNQHSAGTKCREVFTTHPLLTDVEEWRVTERFVADASYYGNRLFHNRNPKASGNRLHECDATVVAYNSLPLGTVLRATYPVTGKVIYLVVQDRGGPHVSRRPDLARGAFELLADREAEGVLRNVVYEVLVPIE